MFDLQNDDAPEYERPNKTLQRREALAMLDLAKRLLELQPSQWVSIGLTDEVIDALTASKNMPQHGAQKRQLKRVAKLLRDQDVSSAQDAVENEVKQTQAVNTAFHKVEMWRDKLILGDRDVITSFLQAYPSTHAQTLNQMVRNAKREQVQGKSPKSAKLLFKFIRDELG